jgi:hypothetical protein
LFVTVIGGYRQLDTSVEASEPHDFAVRRQATSSARRFGAVNAAEYRSPYRKNASISDISEILQHIGAYLPAPTRNGYLPDLLLACSCKHFRSNPRAPRAWPAFCEVTNEIVARGADGRQKEVDFDRVLNRDRGGGPGANRIAANAGINS